MTPATTTEAAVWRRLVWWSRASAGMITGCVFVVVLALVGSAALFLFGARAVHLFTALAVLGVVMEAARRVCEIGRRLALDAAESSLGAARGLSREVLEQAANILPSGRIEELEASLAFDGDPVRRAIEAALGRVDAPLSPLCGTVEGARAVVVNLGHEWAAVLRLGRAQLVEAYVHRRRFAWNDGGPRPIELPLDVEARALVERSLGALPEAAAGPAVVEAARLLGERAVRIGFALVEGEARTRTLAGVVELAGGPLPRVDGGHGGPYRTATSTAPLEVAEIAVEDRQHRLAPAPSDGRAEDVLVHAVVHAAARVVRPLVLVELAIIVKGRPLRVDGVPHLAELRRGSTWIAAVAPVSAGDPAQRAALAQRWLHAALTEHASIAAFERLAGVLAELDAPASLVDRARAAIADETRHARDAFSLAAAYGGQEFGPGPLEVPNGPPPSIDALAIETFVDGCVGETTAAREAAAALARCEVPAARAALVRVATDERRHAELAWDILAWSLPRTSRRARTTIAAVSPPRGGASLRDGSWLARHGWLTRDEELAVAIAAWREEIGPRRAALLETR